MGWEEPLMKLHADVITQKSSGKRILNVGFGLGLVDELIQATNPASHTIIEAHPDVYKKMIQDGWDKKATILFGRWQDVTHQLQVYDGIFFDTFGEFYDEQKEFHEILPNILDENGIYSFFNGLCGTNPFFHDVSCQIAALDLNEMGFQVEYEKIEMNQLGDETWNNVKRPYFNLPYYNLPIVRFDI